MRSKPAIKFASRNNLARRTHHVKRDSSTAPEIPERRSADARSAWHRRDRRCPALRPARAVQSCTSPIVSDKAPHKMLPIIGAFQAPLKSHNSASNGTPPPSDCSRVPPGLKRLLRRHRSCPALPMWQAALPACLCQRTGIPFPSSRCCLGRL
jgi:hypothetical protein